MKIAMIRGPSLGVFDFGRGGHGGWGGRIVGPGFPYPLTPVTLQQPDYLFPVTVEEPPAPAASAPPTWAIAAGAGALGIVAGLLLSR